MAASFYYNYYYRISLFESYKLVIILRSIKGMHTYPPLAGEVARY